MDVFFEEGHYVDVDIMKIVEFPKFYRIYFLKYKIKSYLIETLHGC